MNIQLNVRFRDAQLFEKNVRHISVEVLAGMHDDFRDPGLVEGSFGNHTCLDELRARTDDGQYFHSDSHLPNRSE
ncbi:hypothetical protein D3C76_1474480 [compost metagenome]